MIIAGTGHRPDKLGGYTTEIQMRLTQLAIAAFIRFDPDHVVSGMALGWDTAIANAALDLGIPLIAMIPFVGQEKKWPVAAQKIYHEILDAAMLVEVSAPGGYAPEKMQLRNMNMVNSCDILLALWNGSDGGTANCVRYAREQNKEIHNLWSSWVKYGGIK